MNKLHYKNPVDFKTNINPLINFVENPATGGEGEEKILPSSTQVEDQNLKLVKMPSKYATILTCSFEKGQKMVLGGKLLP
jgi:hypothetical protein